MTTLATAISLIASVAGHARNEATHNAAANVHEDAERYDYAANRRRDRDREHRLVEQRSAQLEEFLRAQEARVKAFESDPEEIVQAALRAAPWRPHDGDPGTNRIEECCSGPW